MPTRTRPGARINTPAQKGRKSTQHARLLAGMVATVNGCGYGGATVSAVIERAGVSRPTFYDYFADRHACFQAALGDVQQQLLERVGQRLEEEPHERALHASVRALVELAISEPALALFLTDAPLAGGPEALEARDRGIAEIEQLVQRSYKSAAAEALIPDVSPGLLLGGVQRLLGARVRRGEPGLSRLLTELLLWIERYERPKQEHRWRTLREQPARRRCSSFEPSLQPPPQLGPGRPRISEQDVAENHRLRILYAAASLAASKGYAATTIADITTLARIDGHVFYSLFTDKQDAFMAVHELGMQQLQAVTASAFFAGSSWPEHILEAELAGFQFLELNPLIAHLGYVEAYAIGPGAVQRVEDGHAAFTIFLQGGYRADSDLPRPSALALEAIATTIFEATYRRTRGRSKPKLSELLGPVGFLSIAPFLGVHEADVQIDRRL